MEKKSFAERYRAWRDKVHEWADGHSVLGFPVRHPTLFLLIIFIVVVAVCGTCNSIARKKAADEDVNTSVVVPQSHVQRAAYSPQYLFSDDGYFEVYWSASDGERGVSGDGYLEDFDFSSICDGRYFNVGVLHDYIDSNYPDLSFDFEFVWESVWFDMSGASLGFNGVELRGDLVKFSYTTCDSNSSDKRSYSYMISAVANGIDFDDSYLYSFSYSYDHSFRLQRIVYFEGGVDSYSYNLGYNTGFNNGYSDGMDKGYDSGYGDGYSIGKEYGYQLGNNSDMTLTTLFWNVIDQPFAVVYRLLNFDVLGVNVFAFVMGLVTLGIVGFVIKLVI